ncbi:MAG: phosphorylase, partial [Chitinophagales bacterium]
AIAPAGIHSYVCSASEKLKPFFQTGFHKGITLTSPGLYGPQGRSTHLSATVQDFISRLNKFRFHDLTISNIEMESSALFGLSKLLGHDCISLNAILANRVTGTFSANPEKTVEALIARALEIISGINS